MLVVGVASRHILLTYNVNRLTLCDPLLEVSSCDIRSYSDLWQLLYLDVFNNCAYLDISHLIRLLYTCDVSWNARRKLKVMEF